MSEHIQQVKEVRNGGVITKTTRTVDDDDLEKRSDVDNKNPIMLSKIVWFIAGVVMALLAIRFVLILLGANSANGFTDLIYSLSYPFAVPFFGVFNYTVKYGVSRVELSTLVAIAIYALIAYGISYLITIRTRSEED